MNTITIVEGLIGAGKSTLTKELAQELGPDTLCLMEPDEQGNANPYLADFYGDKDRWSFTMQAHLLGSRYRMQLAAQWHVLAGQGHAVLDRSYQGDTCFARMMNKTGEISDREFETYRLLYQSMTASVLLPTACVRLRVSPRVSAERIQRRTELREGRKCESGISLDYLESLDREIDNMTGILKQQGVQVFEVPWDTDRADVGSRRGLIREIALDIKRLRPPDMFLGHHRRVL